MKIIRNPTSIKKLWQSKESGFEEMVKIVVDIERDVLAIDAELHADLENLLLEDGSKQENIWGANVYPAKAKDEFIEYTAFINIRPSQNNKSMEILDPVTKEKVKKITTTLLIT
jgi:hypothetical protein